MSVQTPLKERIEDESAKGSGNEESNNGSANDECAKGAGNEESAKGAANDESAKGAGNNESAKCAGKDIAHDAALTREEPIINEGVKDPSQKSSSASITDKNAKAMTDLMWKKHPSVPAQKSAKTVFFEENAKGSSPKWGDQR
jgi:hypothetical protein